jgi:hypothetical protein
MPGHISGIEKMAKLKLVLDSVEGLDEPTRGMYVEKDGKFHLDVDGIEDTSGLKSALQKERKDRADLEKKVKRWEGLGKTDEEIAELIAKHDETSQTEAERKGEWDKLRLQMNEKHAKELAKKDETIGAMRKRLEAELVDARATAAIAAAKGVPDLLLPHVQRHVKVDENFNVVVVDAKGDPRVNGKGEPLSISDLVTEMKSTEIYGRAFEGSGQSGGGTQPGNGGGGNPQFKRRSDFKTEKERAAFVDEHGIETYTALPA